MGGPNGKTPHVVISPKLPLIPKNWNLESSVHMLQIKYWKMEGLGRTNLQHSASSEQLARSENYYSNYHPDCHYPTPPRSTADQDPASAMSVADSPYRTSAAVAGVLACSFPPAWQIASPDYPGCRTCCHAAASAGCSSSYAVAACFGFGGESAFVVEGRRRCFAVRIIRRI